MAALTQWRTICNVARHDRATPTHTQCGYAVDADWLTTDRPERRCYTSIIWFAFFIARWHLLYRTTLRRLQIAVTNFICWLQTLFVGYNFVRHSNRFAIPR